MRVDDRERILMAAANHFDLANLIDASLLTFRNADAYYQLRFAVATMRSRGEYWDIMIWTDIKRYRQDKRPKCDLRVQIDSDGGLYKKKKAGRKRKEFQSEMVSFSLHPRDLRLLNNMSEYRGRSEMLRHASVIAIYLAHVRSIKGDNSLHIRPLPDGFGLYTGGGNCIATNTNEVGLLFDLLPYSYVLSR